MIERIDEVIKRLIIHFRTELGGDYISDYTVKINDFVRDEIDFDELEWPMSKSEFIDVVREFELKFG